jgi:hypothetical protein
MREEFKEEFQKKHGVKLGCVQAQPQPQPQP